MAHIFQVGVGSGGIVVLDALARDPRITRITIVEPDVYGSHNVHRHHFSESAVGRMKADLALEWIKARRADIEIDVIVADLTDPAMMPTFMKRAAECDVGVCAVDNEAAKFAFDSLMRNAGKPWTLGEVLSGGIGGWVHRFTTDGPCYGCVASHLQRNVAEEPAAPPPDYANPNAAIAETRIPANKASIGVIANLHAVATLEILESAARSKQASDDSPGASPRSDEFTSLLFTLARVRGVFEEAFRSYRFRIAKSVECLICSSIPVAAAGEDLDVALDQALARLGHE
ncbi:MAG TPA: ThiF family adenylyltransferase [Urbifossiella sp.]|jgi:molybdopterin/thiamine biosynthesis adenylyltransferase